MNEAKKLNSYTYQDYLEIAHNTDERVEFIFGNIYMMAGASALHQDIVGNIFYQAKSRQTTDNCKPRIAPFDVKLSVNGSINIVQPDVMIFCNKDEIPCAIFEVLSPSTALKDKTVKKKLYEMSGVKEYFLVNSEYKIVEKFKLNDNIYESVGIFGKDDTIEVECLDLEINLQDIFDIED